MIATLTKKLFEKLKRKEYRDAYVAENVRTGIAYQIRALRDQRGWSQKKLSEESGKPQSVVCRMEDPDYGKLSVQSLLEMAATFDIALVIQFVSFPDFIRRTKNVSPEALEAVSFSEKQFRIVRKTAGWFEAATKPLASSRARPTTNLTFVDFNPTPPVTVH